MSLIRNRSERAVSEAHSAGHAFFLVNVSAPELVRRYGFNTAGYSTWPLHSQDHSVLADGHALSALYALCPVNMSLTLVEIYRVFRADLRAWTGKAALTLVCDYDLVVGAGMARELYDVD